MSAPTLAEQPVVAPESDAPVDKPVVNGLTRDRRIWFAQALRGFAAVLVIYEHFVPDFLRHQYVISAVIFRPQLTGLPHTVTGLSNWTESWHYVIGMPGVGIFFLTSGFVIPSSLARGTLPQFIIRRLFRLYPTLWFFTILGVILIAWQTRGHPFPLGKSEVFTSALLIAPYFGKRWVDPVCWTLAIEELFYLAAALLAWRKKLFSVNALWATAIGFTVFSVLMGDIAGPTATSTTAPHHYFWRNQLAINSTFVVYILMGTVIYNWYTKRWSARLAIASLCGFSFLYSVALYPKSFGLVEHSAFGGPGQGEPGVYLVNFLIALVVFVGGSLAFEKIPWNRFLNWSADISFSVYLLHTILGWIMLRFITEETGSFWLALAITVPTIFLGAAVINRFVEVPTNELGKRIARRFAGKATLPAPITSGDVSEKPIPVP
jgi:peptidoglycan/LPS O-acetylase OafA/YrhL